MTIKQALVNQSVQSIFLNILLILIGREKLLYLYLKHFYSRKYPPLHGFFLGVLILGTYLKYSLEIHSLALPCSAVQQHNGGVSGTNDFMNR